MTTLTFRTWSREQIGALATSTSDGRARAQTAVTLTGTDASGATTTTESRTIAFLLAGPPDVGGLKPGAITSRYPAPGTIDAESDKSSHIEFAEPALPWRYSPAANPAAGSGSLVPWLALVVGVEETELTLRGDSVTLSQSVQQDHPIGGAVPFPWGHVQVDETGRQVSRLLSGRPLFPGTDYLAVVVPAYSETGALAWTGTGSVTLPVFDRWRFRTAQPAGSFRDLAAALNPGEADPATGRAPVDYPRVPDAPDLEIRGALAPVGSTVAALATEVADDLAGLMTPATDEVGRPIVGLPRYGDAWVADPGLTDWGDELNGDPRQRGVAGVGLEMGIRLQDELVDEAREHAGALEVAAQRIADLVLGLEAGRSIWTRRLPSDPLRRLWVLGPALRRVVTDAGPVADLATADDRALPRGLFSSAARRVLRPGPARSAIAGSRAVDPSAILVSANRCPVPPKPRDDGVAFDAAGVTDFEDRRRRTVETGELDLSLLAEAVRSIDLDPAPDQLKDMLAALVDRIVSAAEQGAPAPYGEALSLLFRALAVNHEDEEAIAELHRELRVLVDRFGQGAEDPREFVDLLIDLEEPKGEERPCRPVDLDRLAVVAGAFDPTAVDGPARVRVLSTIEGLDPAEPLAPPEVCIGLDRPVWRDVEETFPEWLLPGVAALPQDSVIALETNPAFTDAVLVGYNSQLLSELRWRNLRVATGCTPLRVFWERANTASGDRIDDIIGVLNWPAASDVGASSHRPGGASGTDLVLVFRGRLFLRYPKTLIYLVSARHGGTVDWDADPDPAAARILPSFQGRIGTDVTFFGFQGVAPSAAEDHWVVLEEPPTGYRFYNEGEKPAPVGADSAGWAAAMFADPVRVLIRGDSLVPEVTP